VVLKTGNPQGEGAGDGLSVDRERYRKNIWNTADAMQDSPN